MLRSPVLALCIVLVLALGSGADLRAQTDRAALRQQLREALALEGAGQLGRAYIELQTILRDHPAETAAVLAFERVCRRLGVLADALPAVRRAVEYDRTNALLRQTELRVLGDLGRTAELIEAGERWLQAAPQVEAAYREFGRALREAGLFERAEAVLLEGQRQVGGSGALAMALADLYMATARWSEAVNAWLAIFELAPEMAWDAVVARSRSPGMDIRAFGEAAVELIASVPATEGTARLGVIAAIYVGDVESAREMAAAALEHLSEGERRRFMEDFARLAATLQQPALVAWAYRRLLRESPGAEMAWEMARQVVQHDLDAGDTAAAFATLGRLTDDVEPGLAAHRWAAGTRVRLLAAGSDPEAAGRAFARYASLYSEDRELPTLALLVAEAFLRHGDLGESRRVLDLLPPAPDGRASGQTSALRAYLALYAGEFDEARRQFELAAATLTGSERGDVIRTLRILRHANPAELAAVSAAHLSILRDEPRQAYRQLLDRLAAAPASGARAALLVWAGELAIDAGDVDRGAEVLLQVPEAYPESGEAPLALITLAEALAASDRRDQAIRLLERLIIDYPESALTPIGRRRLAELEGEVPRS